MTDQNPQANIIDLRGVKVFKSYLNPLQQSRMVSAVREIVSQAPMLAPFTVSGKSMSVRMSAAGDFGWITDHNGYRYEPKHPNGSSWPAIPDCILQVWDDCVGVARPPDCCLINYYHQTAKMGLHQDKDEASFDFPVMSISLGDAGLFRVGGVERKGKTESIWLDSGDVCVLGGAARLAYHGIDRIRFGSSKLLKAGGRINLTLRVVT